MLRISQVFPPGNTLTMSFAFCFRTTSDENGLTALAVPVIAPAMRLAVSIDGVTKMFRLSVFVVPHSGTSFSRNRSPLAVYGTRIGRLTGCGSPADKKTAKPRHRSEEGAS